MERVEIERYLTELSSLIDHVDPSTVIFSYDYDSDTLIVHLSGRGRPGVSLPIAQGWMVRLDRESDEVIGVQIEGVLARASRIYPKLLGVLDLAELRGIAPDEIDQVRREVAAPSPSDALRWIVDGFPVVALAAV